MPVAIGILISFALCPPACFLLFHVSHGEQKISAETVSGVFLFSQTLSEIDPRGSAASRARFTREPCSQFLVPFISERGEHVRPHSVVRCLNTACLELNFAHARVLTIESFHAAVCYTERCWAELVFNT